MWMFIEAIVLIVAFLVGFLFGNFVMALKALIAAACFVFAFEIVFLVWPLKDSHHENTGS